MRYFDYNRTISTLQKGFNPVTGGDGMSKLLRDMTEYENWASSLSESRGFIEELQVSSDFEKSSENRNIFDKSKRKDIRLLFIGNETGTAGYYLGFQALGYRQIYRVDSIDEAMEFVRREGLPHVFIGETSYWRTLPLNKAREIGEVIETEKQLSGQKSFLLSVEAPGPEKQVTPVIRNYEEQVLAVEFPELSSSESRERMFVLFYEVVANVSSGFNSLGAGIISFDETTVALMGGASTVTAFVIGGITSPLTLTTIAILSLIAYFFYRQAAKEDREAFRSYFRNSLSVSLYDMVELRRGPNATFKLKPREKMPSKVLPADTGNAEHLLRNQKIQRAIDLLREKGFSERADEIEEKITFFGLQNKETNLLDYDMKNGIYRVMHVGRRRDVFYIALKLLDRLKLEEDVDMEVLASALNWGQRFLNTHHDLDSRGVSAERMHHVLRRHSVPFKDASERSAFNQDAINARLLALALEDEQILQQTVKKEAMDERIAAAKLAEEDADERWELRPDKNKTDHRDQYASVANQYAVIGDYWRWAGEDAKAHEAYQKYTDIIEYIQPHEGGLWALEAQEDLAYFDLKRGLYGPYLKKLKALLTGRGFHYFLNEKDQSVRRTFLNSHDKFMKKEVLYLLTSHASMLGIFGRLKLFGVWLRTHWLFWNYEREKNKAARLSAQKESSSETREQELKIEEFKKLIYQASGGLTANLREGDSKMKFGVNPEFIHDHRQEFIQGIRELAESMKKNDRVLEEGTPYYEMEGSGNFNLDTNDVMMLILIGNVLGLWSILTGIQRESGAKDPAFNFPKIHNFNTEELGLSEARKKLPKPQPAEGYHEYEQVKQLFFEKYQTVEEDIQSESLGELPISPGIFSTLERKLNELKSLYVYLRNISDPDDADHAASHKAIKLITISVGDQLLEIERRIAWTAFMVMKNSSLENLSVSARLKTLFEETNEIYIEQITSEEDMPHKISVKGAEESYIFTFRRDEASGLDDLIIRKLDAIGNVIGGEKIFEADDHLSGNYADI